MKKVLLFVQLCLLTLTMNAVTMVHVSLEEALAVVKNHFIGQNVDYYLCGTAPSWKIFVDAEPLSGWEHTCYLYSIRRAHKDTENMIVTCEELTLPPADDMTPLDVQNFVSDTPNATPYVPQSSLTNAVLTAAERTYAVILSGGVNKNSNYVRYWNDCSFIYQTLVKKYGVPKDNINVIMSDGTDPAADMKLMDLSYVSSPLDLDGDSYDDIEYSATRTNVQSVLNSLSSTLQKDDHLFIFVIDHGGSTDGITHSYINLWGNEKLYDYELANWLRPFTNNYVNVNVVLGQCFSGGFIDDLTMVGCVVATACTGSEYSWACDNLIYDEFVYQWTSAVNKARPNGGYVYSDTDNNGVVTMLEAFEYAKNNDQQPAEHPQYISTPASVGEDLGFNQIAPSVDLYIRDNVADTGKEPNRTTDVFWDSPDVWLRNSDDNGLTHENPYYATDHIASMVYVRIHNRGKETYTRGKWLHLYWANTSTGITARTWNGYELYNEEYVTGGSMTPIMIDTIAPGESIIMKFAWAYPQQLLQQYPDRTHYCILARILDTPLPQTASLPNYYDITGSNDFAQKNVTIINKNELNNEIPVFVRNVNESTSCYSLEVRPRENRDNALFNYSNVEMVMSDAIHAAWQRGGEMSNSIERSPSMDNTVYFTSKESCVEDIIMNDSEFEKVSIRFNFIYSPIVSETYTVDLIQRDENGVIVGGETFIVQTPGLDESEVQPMDPIEVGIDSEELGGEAVILSASSSEPLQTTMWQNSKGQIISRNSTINVTPTESDNTYKLTAITNDGILSNNSITLEPTIGIKSINPSVSVGNNVVVELFGEAGNNVLLNICSVSQSTLLTTIPVESGSKTVTINTSNLPSGIYTITYISNGENIGSKKFTK